VSKIIHLDVVQTAIVPYIILSALIGAISWNLITWFFGLPTSSSHALIGGLAGAGISAAGLAAIKIETITVVAAFMIISPIVGFFAGFLFMAIVLWLTRKSNKQIAETYFKRLQLCSAAAYSFSHGTNDAQKTMGIILPLLFSIGYFGASVDPNNLPMPLWVILASYAAIALGTLSGGWRIVKTMGYKITKLRPVHGFAAETAGAATILGASIAGIPVSTTHIICTSIMGVGSTMGTSTVKWGVARSIMFAWIMTIPISALIGYAMFAIVRVIIGY
jgi:PiT family inorganic phosphate transporter